MSILALVHGATAMASAIAALFFLRFWQRSRDRLFIMFSVAFAVLGTNRVALALVHVEAENVPYLYSLRLIAFALIAFAIVDKNRRSSLGGRE